MVPSNLMLTRWLSSNGSRDPEPSRCVLSLTETCSNRCVSALAELLQFLRRLLRFRTIGIFFLNLLEEKPGVTCILQFSKGVTLLEHSCCDFWILAMFLNDLIISHDSRLILLLGIQGFTNQILGISGLWRLRSLLQKLLKIHHSSLVILLLVILQSTLVQLLRNIRLRW